MQNKRGALEDRQTQISTDEELNQMTRKKMKWWTDWDPLQKYNFVLFIVHLILTVAVWIYLHNQIDNQNPIDGLNLDLYDHILTSGGPNTPLNMFEVVSSKANDVSEGEIANLIAGFFAITAGFHLLYAFNPSNIYLAAVENGNNYLRWLEYAMSATIMIVIIAILSGVKDVKTVFLIATSAIGMIATGQWFETSAGNARWIPIIVGFLLLGGILLTIYTSFQQRLKEAEAAGFELPNWLSSVIIVTFVFYACFGFVPIINVLFGGMYRKYEYAYLTLSLASKASLGAFIAYGFGQRVQNPSP